MILTHTIGGLGNQMFQYAAGRALSLKLGQLFRLDTSSFKDYGLHQGFELQRVFNCQVQVATQSDIYRVLGWQSLPIIRRLLTRSGFSALRRKEFVAEPHFHFWPGISEAHEDCYLVGYWQSEKFFQSHAQVISDDFTFALPLNDENIELAKQISEVQSVSLHVRRGDYINNLKTNATHGLCSIDYYQAAIQYISNKVKRPYFFIFSDDIAWVKDNLKMELPYQYVDHNQGASSFNDMRLMSLCQHNIIANSSFSWWGAWLNSNPGKIVIAPRRWFTSNWITSDLTPASWVKL